MNIKLQNEDIKNNFLENLLIYRGINPSELNLYMKPDISLLSDPESLDNIKDAANKFIEAAGANKKFALIADCDVDGLTSSSILYLYAKEIWPDISIDLYNHTGKQHGLSDLVDIISTKEYDFILEPDAGINDKAYHDSLGELGMYTIVLDHHEYENNGFSKYAVYVDNQIGDYSNKSLSGAGVTWQFCRMVDKILNKDLAFKYIDLVALGCCADVMSTLTLENRFIFEYGFSHINNPMFMSLCEKQAFSMKNKVNYENVAFYIAPLLNACMRSGTQEEKARMYKSFIDPNTKVLTNKRGHAPGEQVELSIEVARELTNIKARQQKLIDTYESIFEDKINSEGLSDNNIIFIELTEADKFSSELNGLIAMRLASKYKKPVIIARNSLIDGQAKGSMRNPNGSPISNLKEVITSYSHTAFVMGHANAAGVGIETSHINDFVNWFNYTTKELDFGENCVEANIVRPGISPDIKDIILSFGLGEAIWGGDNTVPVIVVTDIHINKKDINIIGKLSDTLKFSYNGIDYIKFKAKDIIAELDNYGDRLTINIAGTANINEFYGRVTPQIMISDLEIKNESIIDF